MKALLEVFDQPGTLFESLPERRSAWVAPLLACIVVMTLLTVLTVNLIGMREIMQQRLATSGLNPEQLQQALANADKPAQVYVSYAAAAIVAPVTLLVIAGALTAFGMMTSRAPKFGAMFAMVALAFFPYWLVTGAMSAVIILGTPDRSTLDISNIIATNAAAYYGSQHGFEGYVQPLWVTGCPKLRADLVARVWVFQTDESRNVLRSGCRRHAVGLLCADEDGGKPGVLGFARSATSGGTGTTGALYGH